MHPHLGKKWNFTQVIQNCYDYEPGSADHDSGGEKAKKNILFSKDTYKDVPAYPVQPWLLGAS